MDLNSSEGNDLKDFLINNEMKNYVNVHTRIARTFYKKKQKYVESKTLIDVKSLSFRFKFNLFHLNKINTI